MKMMKKGKILFILLIGLMMSSFFVNSAFATSSNSTALTSDTFTRSSDTAVSLAIAYNFNLTSSYTTLKLYFVLLPSTYISVGSAIGTQTDTYSSYTAGTSGTSGKVSGTSTLTAYDYQASQVGIYGGSAVYLYLLIYNDTVSSANLIITSSYVLNYWPYGGLYDSATITTSTPATTSYSWETYALLSLAFIGAVVIIIYVNNRMHLVNFKNDAPSRDILQFPDGRKELAQRWQKNGWHRDEFGNEVYHRRGQFNNIVNMHRSMSEDRLKHNQHRYSNGADQRPRR